MRSSNRKCHGRRSVEMRPTMNNTINNFKWHRDLHNATPMDAIINCVIVNARGYDCDCVTTIVRVCGSMVVRMCLWSRSV
eukprot:11163800-Lingulodinium_polyedra.AAC.1